MKLATTAVMIAAPTVAVTSPAIAAERPARQGKSAPNHAAYWGDDCAKVDHGVGNEGVTLVVERDYRLVVLKSATTNDAFDDVRAGDRLSTSTGQAISHYILCAGASVASTTTTSTTVPPTTTVPVVPSTTSTTTTSTTVPPTTTVPVVPASVPTSTTTTTTTTTTTVPLVPASAPTSTTTTTTTTTSTTGPATTTVPVVPASAPTSTTNTTTTTTVPASVPPAPTTPLGDDLPVAATPAAQISAASDERLAFTGADVWGIVLLGIVLIGLGTTMTRVRRLVEARVAERSTTAGD